MTSTPKAHSNAQQAPPKDEVLVCFDREVLRTFGDPQGFFTDDSLWSEILASVRKVSRSRAETDFSLKQLVSYCVVHCESDVLCYERPKRSGDSRLRGASSIGIGGHVNAQDLRQQQLVPSRELEASIRHAMWREIEEEIVLEGIRGEPRLIGYINDDSNDVGKVHLGVVWLVRTTRPEVRARRGEGLLHLGFKHLDEMPVDNLESWSQILVKYLQENPGMLT